MGSGIGCEKSLNFALESVHFIACSVKNWRWSLL